MADNIAQLQTIDESPKNPERGAPAPDRIVAGTPTTETWSTYESADGRTYIGLWRATPGTWRVSYTEWEYCEILEGITVVSDAAGRQRTFQAGDKFVLEPGFEGLWQVVETTTKRYIIVLPEPVTPSAG